MDTVSRWRRGGALLLCALVLAAAVGAVLATQTQARLVGVPHHYPWWLLAGLYLPLSRCTLDFEFRGQSRSVALTQLPLALGLVYVGPVGHLAARLATSFADSALWRRQSPVKLVYNLASASLELALACLALAALPPMDTPGPFLWATLLVAAVAADVAGQLLLLAVMRLLALPLPAGDLRGPLLLALATTPVATGLAVVAVAAVWTEPLTAVVIAVLSVVLVVVYRSHRRLVEERHTAALLHDFVARLGALDADLPEAETAVEQMRVLLDARHLDLALLDPGGVQWRHLTSHESEADTFAVVDPRASGSTAVPVQTADRMSVPLVGQHGFLGLLTVWERLGGVRGFELSDLRAVETLGTELAASLERGRLQAELSRAATTDALTGLPNLRQLSLHLDAALTQGPGLMVAAVAVDSFREVNDTLGHQVGDDLLREVTHRLQRTYPEALIGRIGGGRFAVAVPVGEHGSDPELFGLGLRSHVEGGAQLGAVGTHVRLSIGLAVAPEHGTDGATLLRRAETAMYGARGSHAGPTVWEPLYEVRGQRRLAVVAALREALSSGSLGVHYQPKVRLADRSVSGVEALARWTHPALGAIGPDEFIPLAEAAGLMAPLTSTVLRQALTACQGWQRRGGTGVGVAVNVSADTVLDSAFATEVSAQLVASGLDPSLLTLELTESVLVSDPALAIERMQQLRSLGVRISMDDFGTGYSSLTYLRGLPVDEVKIDKSFVDGLDTDPANAAVVRAVVDIAHTLGLRVVAEGVEHEAQDQLLRALGVDEAQGYLHARPAPSLQTGLWLRRRSGSQLG